MCTWARHKMSPNLPSAYLCIMSQLLLPPPEQLTPSRVAFLGCNCHNINSTDVSRLQAPPRPCMGPHKESRHEKCSQGRGREEAPAGRAQLCQFADTAMSGTRPLHHNAAVCHRGLLLWSLLHLDGGFCVYKESFCAADGHIFHFHLAVSIGNSRRKRGQQT